MVDTTRIAKKILSAEAAGHSTDPAFYGRLGVLPNPDPILRRYGYANEVYEAIAMDAHVMGELRSVRSGLLGYQFRIVSGSEASPEGKEQAALELCQQWLKQRPCKDMTWQDVVWNMAGAIFHGFRVHELVWGSVDNQLLPVKVLDRPNRRFRFDVENNLRLLTKQNASEGEETDDYKYLLARHMPSSENPYGMAVFSSCFWPYTFKHGGFKFFYKFCERFGLPWPIGKYAKGTPLAGQQELLDALLNMVEDGVGVIPEGDSVELMTISNSGDLAQEALVHLCNREMSKALTSQTLATENQGVGSNAASKTHQARQSDVQESDRSIIESTFNQAFRWITLFNFGSDVEPPKFEFFKRKEVKKERAEQWEIATRIGRPSLKGFHKEMNIPEAEDDDDLMVVRDSVPQPAQAEFTQGSCGRC